MFTKAAPELIHTTAVSWCRLSRITHTPMRTLCGRWNLWGDRPASNAASCPECDAQVIPPESPATATASHADHH